MTKIDKMQSVEFFQFLTSDVLQALAEEAELETFPKNALVISQGETGDKIYFIVEGHLQAFLLDKQGKEIVIAELKENDYFGELSLITNEPRSCSIRATSTCTLISLSKDSFFRLSHSYPQVSLTLTKILSKRLRSTLNLVADKKKNDFIFLICTNESFNIVERFLNYFKKITTKSIRVNEGIHAETFNSTYEEHYVFLKIKPGEETSFNDKADYIINFVEKQNNHFALLSDSSTWKIENIARRITKKTIGLALCSGGAPAAAHIGVFEKLKQENIPIDYIVGSSAGALFGGCFAFQLDYYSLLNILMNENARNIFKVLLMHGSRNFSGLVQSKHYQTLFQKFFDDAMLEESMIPFAAVASDLLTGKTVILEKGNAAEAILASNAAPVIMEPVPYRDMLLIDGVATAPLPIEVLIKNNIDIKIAVPIPQLDLSVSMKKNSKIPTIYIRSRSMMAEAIVNNSLELADVIISPNVKGIKIIDWKNTDAVIEEGKKATEMAIKRIHYLFQTR